MLFKAFSIYISGGLFSAEQNHLINFGEGSYEEHFCEFILKSGHLPLRKHAYSNILNISIPKFLDKNSDIFNEYRQSMF